MPLGRRLLVLSTLGLAACARQPGAVTPAWSADGEVLNSSFGLRAMGLGDINGDGYGDLSVSAPSFENGRGKAYVYCGGPQGLSAEPCWSRAGENVGDRYSDRMGQTGDLNGDGFDDLYVSVPSWRKGPGRLEVFYGGKRGLAGQADWAQDGSGREAEQFGDCTHPTGDVNGDGFDDLLIGAYQATSSAGRALLYLGGPKGLAKQAAWIGRGEAEGDQYAYTLGHVGDLDGDGRSETVIGAKFHDASAEQGRPAKSLFMAGKAYVYRGAEQGMGRLLWTEVGREAQTQLSVRSYGMGDVDGDGSIELLLSEPGADEGHGCIRVINSRGFRLISRVCGRALGLMDFGRASGPAGDLNGDGYQDLIAAGRLGEQGRVYVWFGGPKGFGPKPDLRLQTDDEGGAYGAWVAPAGDLDGDGRPDLVVSAELYSGVKALAGRVYVFYGRQLPGQAPKKATMNVYLSKK